VSHFIFAIIFFPPRYVFKLSQLSFPFSMPDLFDSIGTERFAQLPTTATPIPLMFECSPSLSSILFFGKKIPVLEKED